MRRRQGLRHMAASGPLQILSAKDAILLPQNTMPNELPIGPLVFLFLRPKYVSQLYVLEVLS